MIFSKKVFSTLLPIPTLRLTKSISNLANLVWEWFGPLSMWLLSMLRAWSWRFSTWVVSFKPTVSEREYDIQRIGGDGTKQNDFLFFLPGLKSKIAFMQANSAGLTPIALNRPKIKDRWWSRSLVSVDTTSKSDKENSDGFSNGRHHWMAHSRKSSDHDSSNKVTCKMKT